MTHIYRASDIELVARRLRRTLDLLETRGERTWKLTAEWSGHLRAAGGEGATSSGDISRPTENAALDDRVDDVAKLHDRYRAALALAVDAFDEVERIITTATSSSTAAANHRRSAERKADLCLSCDRIGAVEPRRGARWCRWCEDLVRALVAEYHWEPNTAPPLTLVRKHADRRRITVGDVGEAMRGAGAKRRPMLVPEQEGAPS